MLSILLLLLLIIFYIIIVINSNYMLRPPLHLRDYYCCILICLVENTTSDYFRERSAHRLLHMALSPFKAKSMPAWIRCAT